MRNSKILRVGNTPESQEGLPLKKEEHVRRLFSLRQIDTFESGKMCNTVHMNIVLVAKKLISIHLSMSQFLRERNS